jgi:hypothetical protein
MVLSDILIYGGTAMSLKLMLSEEVKKHLMELREALAKLSLDDTEVPIEPQYGCGGTCKALCCHEINLATEGTEDKERGLIS